MNGALTEVIEGDLNSHSKGGSQYTAKETIVDSSNNMKVNSATSLKKKSGEYNNQG